MRQIEKQQRVLGQVSIGEIKFRRNKVRDDIPKLLIGLQAVYTDEKSRIALFSVLEKMVPPEVDKNNGRPGMDLWRIFVMGMLRVHLKWDYCRLEEMVNNHHKIREMLGHSWEDDKYEYELDTIKGNLALFTDELIEEANYIMVSYGHQLVKKKKTKRSN